jgi:2-dehydropantoate 2-reductase
MRILVIGAGAVGGYFGGRLQAGGHRVTFLARGPRLAALAATGLRIRSPLGDLTLPTVEACATPPADPQDPVDVTLIAVKAFDTAQALALVPATGAVLTLQNGVENADRLLRAFGPERSLGGTCSLEVDSPEVTLGPLAPPGAPHAEAAARAFSRSAVDTRTLPDGRTAMWRKAMFLSPFSALTALLDRPWGRIRPHAAAFAVAEAMAREIAAAGSAAGVPGLDGDAVAATLARFRSVPDAMTSSLHRDLRRGRPLELDDQLGAILRAASRAGTSAPTTAALYGCLTAIAQGG